MAIFESPTKDFVLIHDVRLGTTITIHKPDLYESFKHFTEDCWRLYIGVDSISEKELMEVHMKSKEHIEAMLTIEDTLCDDENQLVTLNVAIEDRLLTPLSVRVRLGMWERVMPVKEPDGRFKFLKNPKYIVNASRFANYFVNALPVHDLVNKGKYIYDKTYDEIKKEMPATLEDFKLAFELAFYVQPLENLFYKFIDWSLDNARPTIRINDFVGYYRKHHNLTLNKVELATGVFVNYFVPPEDEGFDLEEEFFDPDLEEEETMTTSIELGATREVTD